MRVASWRPVQEIYSPGPCDILPGMYCPTEEIFVIPALTPEGDQGVYLLVGQSGKTCRRLCRGTDFFGCNFVNDEECLIDSKDASGEYLLRLFNIKSGDILGVMVKQLRTFCLASCPLKRLVAIDVGNDDSERIFQVIQLKLPRDKDNKKKNKGWAVNKHFFNILLLSSTQLQWHLQQVENSDN